MFNSDVPFSPSLSFVRIFHSILFGASLLLGAQSDALAQCGALCGVDDGLRYAGQEAFSNGSQTGTGNSCTTVGTYGYRYQCVEFVERVNRRADWSGNAYAGYWSSLTSGPYQKGLLPIASGTSYLPPLHGDIVVWSGSTYGHVGIVSSVSASTGAITIIDQNRSCGKQTCTLGYSNSNGYTLSNGNCFSGTTYKPVGYLRRGWDFSGYFGLASSETRTNWWTYDAPYRSSASTTSGATSDITDYVTIDPGFDPAILSPKGLALPAYSTTATHGYRKFMVWLRSNCVNKGAQFFWRRTTDAAFTEANSKKVFFSGTGWVGLTFDMSAHSGWTGTIDQIRLDPAGTCSASSSTDTISIAYAYFSR